MSKRVETRYAVLPALADRWSPRSFDPRAPEPEKLQSIFEAARLAPSAHNTQPVRFLAVRKSHDEAHSKLFACLSDGNRVWAHSAPLLVLACVMRQRFSQERAAFVPYPHAMHDLGLAVMSMILQAQALGIHCHPLAGFDPEQAQSAFAIPALFEPAVVIAIGYLGDPDTLPDGLRARELGPRTRRPLEELVFEQAWGQASALFSGQRQSDSDGDD
jgi:nitroreductase